MTGDHSWLVRDVNWILYAISRKASLCSCIPSGISMGNICKVSLSSASIWGDNCCINGGLHWVVVKHVGILGTRSLVKLGTHESLQFSGYLYHVINAHDEYRLLG